MAPTTRNRQGQTLIGLLVVLMIILILAAVFWPKIAGTHSEPGEPRTPIERAHGAACSEYASQLNQALELYKTDHDDRLPRHLEALKQYGATDEMIYAQGCYFQIDPQAGQVVDLGLSQVHPQQAPADYYRLYNERQRNKWYGGQPAPQGFHPDAPPPPPAPPGGGYPPLSPYGQPQSRYNPGGNGGPPGGPGGQGAGADDDGGGDSGMNLRPTPPPRIGPGGIQIPPTGGF